MRRLVVVLSSLLLAVTGTLGTAPPAAAATVKTGQLPAGYEAINGSCTGSYTVFTTVPAVSGNLAGTSHSDCEGLLR